VLCIVRPLCLLGFFVLVLILPGSASAESNLIRYPKHQAKSDPQLAYMLDVLKLAIDESHTRYQPVSATATMVQSREILDLQQPKPTLDIIWVMTSPTREQELLPIRIPVDRGLIGWRIPLVSARHIDLFKGIKTLAELAALTAGQMHDWPDTTILRSNGLNVLTTDQYEGLFNMLSIDRFDYFPRSLIEISNELESHRALQLAIDPHVLIRYPAAFYFFVSPQRPKLAADLENGLIAAEKDGKLKALFEHHFAATLKQLDVANRTVIDLKNPLLPASAPLQHKEYWFEVGE